MSAAQAPRSLADISVHPVRPEARELIALRGIALALQLERNAAKSLRPGALRTRFRGRGMEFSEVRPYQAGDDIRSIDWKVTARRGRPHTKLFTEERERPVLLAVDLRRSMHFATRGRFKAAQAAVAASLLAWNACRKGDRLGGLVFSEQGAQPVKDRRGDKGALHLIRALMRPGFWEGAAGGDAPAQAALDALHRLRAQAHPGSRIYLLSDLRNLSPAAEHLLADISRHNELVLVMLEDAIDSELPPKGIYPLELDGAFYRLDASNPVVRARHRLRYEAHLARWRKLARHDNIFLMRLDTREEPSGILRRGHREGFDAR